MKRRQRSLVKNHTTTSVLIVQFNKQRIVDMKKLGSLLFEARNQLNVKQTKTGSREFRSWVHQNFKISHLNTSRYLAHREAN